MRQEPVMQVVALIHEGNGEFAAAFPDFPGVMAIAEDLDTVIAKAADALSGHATRMIENGEDPPPLRSLSEIADDPAFREDCVGAMVALVPLRSPARLVQVTIALDEALLAQLDQAAQARGEPRSKCIAEALRRALAADGAPAIEPGRDATSTAATPPAHVHQLMDSIRRSIAVIDGSS
jgi:predicted RNase H-like HicB family nuclease